MQIKNIVELKVLSNQKYCEIIFVLINLALEVAKKISHVITSYVTVRYRYISEYLDLICVLCNVSLFDRK